ncbi:MAG: RNA 2',3'-cyclic phosphodiesterase [Propionicimonas sp.]
MSLRLFVAVLPPPPVVAAWDTLLEPRRDADPSLRWTLPESWHVTCAFMPAVPETRLDALAEALDAVAERTPPFEVVVAGAGAFPDPDHAKALWLGVREGSDPLARLAGRCRTAVAGCGVEVDGGRFRPHLTLARTRPASATRWLRVLDALPPQAWTVDGFSLVHSRSLPGGAGYLTLREHRLAGPLG